MCSWTIADIGKPEGAQTLDGSPAGSRVPGQVNRMLVAGRRVFAVGQYTHAGGRLSPGFAIWEHAP